MDNKELTITLNVVNHKEFYNVLREAAQKLTQIYIPDYEERVWSVVKTLIQSIHHETGIKLFVNVEDVSYKHIDKLKIEPFYNVVFVWSSSRNTHRFSRLLDQDDLTLCVADSIEGEHLTHVKVLPELQRNLKEFVIANIIRTKEL